jgi:hypothetical protein
MHESLRSSGQPAPSTVTTRNCRAPMSAMKQARAKFVYDTTHTLNRKEGNQKLHARICDRPDTIDKL